MGSYLNGVPKIPAKLVKGYLTRTIERSEVMEARYCIQITVPARRQVRITILNASFLLAIGPLGFPLKFAVNAIHSHPMKFVTSTNI